MVKNYYEILGIPRNTSKEDIKRAYYILAHQYHPDKNNGNEKRFKEINEAYRVLSGDLSKIKYDQSFDNDFYNSKIEEETKIPDRKKKSHQWAYIVSFIVVFLLVKSAISSFITKANSDDSSQYSAPTAGSASAGAKSLQQAAKEAGVKPLQPEAHPSTFLSPLDVLTKPRSIAPITNQTDSLPLEIGQCTTTAVAEVGTRLMNTPGSGSYIRYSDGGSQVSYDTISGIDNSYIGDSIFLCLISIPTDCPPGDNRGRNYTATNLRTGEAWRAQDSSHSCGGA